MRLARVRPGELLALAGAVCVIVSLFLRWYESPSGSLDAWSTFGATIVLLLLASAGAIVLFLVTMLERTTALPVAIEVSSAPIALAGLIAALVRVLERPDGATSICAGAWLALAGAAAIFAGTWQAMRDERRSLYPPATPTPRPPP